MVLSEYVMKIILKQSIEREHHEKVFLGSCLGIILFSFSNPVPAQHVDYSTYLGGTGDDYGYAITVNSQFQAFVTGYTYSTDFPVKTPFQSYNAGGPDDVFVSKLSSSGSTLIYSTYF